MSEEPVTETPASALKTGRKAERIPLWLVLAGIIGLIVFFWKNDAAFPTASLELKKSRSEILQLSEDWCRRVGYEPAGTIKSTVFNWDNTAKTFLEYEFGSTRANELMRSGIPVWYWRSRFCRELQDEETRVYLSPTGSLVGLWHKLQNDHALPSLSHDQARELARDFVEKSAAVSLKDYKLTNDSKEDLPSRTDHSFTWERPLPDLHGAKMRAFVHVSGNLVSQYRNQLYVPEAWGEKFKTIRGYNLLLGQIAGVPYQLLGLSIVFLFFRAVQTHTIRWRFSIVSGAILALGALLAALNDWSSVLESYSTIDTLQVFFVNWGLQQALATLMMFIVCTCFVAAGESYYRKNYGNKLAVENYFRLLGLSTKQAALGMAAGLCGFGFAVGWVVAYYLVGEKIGFWCPLGITNLEILGSAFPFYSAICLGVRAAVSEEILYRVIGMSFAQKIVRNFWVANLMQAAAWGFMHSTYPQQPAYARGVELTCSGLVFGWIMRRYGLIPCIVAHYLLDAFLDSQTSLRSSVPALQLSGLIPILPLFVVALYSYWRSLKSSPQQEEALTNAAIKPVAAPQAVRDQSRESHLLTYQPLSNKVRMALLVTALAALPLGAMCRSSPGVGDGFKLSTNRDEAIAAARQVMRRHHIDWRDYQVCTWVEDDISRQSEQNPFQYAFEKVPLPKVMDLAHTACSGFVWRTRFFRVGDRSEYEVDLDSNGNEISFDVTKPEDATGAKLDQNEARKVAEEYLTTVRPNLGPHELENVSEEQEANRTDYQFKFKVPSLKVGDAEFEIAANVIGDEPSQVSQDWDLPDQWMFERKKTSSRIKIAKVVKNVATIGIGLVVVWWMIGVLRTGVVRWRPALTLAIAMAILNIPMEINDFPTLLRAYQTNVAINQFAFLQCLDLVKGMMAKVAEILLTGAFALAASKLLFPKFSIPEFVRTTFAPAKTALRKHRQIWTDAALAAYWLVVCDWLIDCIAFAAEAHISPTVPSKLLSNVALNANVFSAPADNLLNGITKGVRETLQVGIFAGLYAKYMTSTGMFLVLAVLQNVIEHFDSRYMQDVVISSLSGIGSSLLYWFFVTRMAKKNLLAYFLAGFASLIFRRIPVLLGDALPHFAGDVISIILLLLLPLIYVVFLQLRNRYRPEPPEPEEAETAEDAKIESSPMHMAPDSKSSTEPDSEARSTRFASSERANRRCEQSKS